MFPFWKSNNLESLSAFGKKVEVVDDFNQKIVKIKLDPCLNIPEHPESFLLVFWVKTNSNPNPARELC